MKHTPNNWIIILSGLASNGPMTSGQIRQQLCMIRLGSYEPERDRGQYTWYTSFSGFSWRKMGMDYGYMDRLAPDENGVTLYEITEKGLEYLVKNHAKPGYGCNWRLRGWGRRSC